MTAPARQRVDIWLWHARFTKSRALATKLVTEGGVRLMRDGASRQLEKPSVEVKPGDALVFPLRGALRAVKELGGKNLLAGPFKNGFKSREECIPRATARVR